jgi:amino acid transporter
MVQECSDPKRDAPRAIVGEAVLGLAIYTMVPLAFLVVLGFKAIALDPYAMPIPSCITSGGTSSG